MKNKLGLWTTTSLVVGNMVGAGVFLLPAALASFGGISLIGWALSAVGALFIARVFSNMSKLLPGVSGGPYAYSREGLGDFTGFLMAWGYWISVWTSNAAIAISLIGALSTFFPILTSDPVIAVLTGLCAIWLLTWVNTRGIRESGQVQLITTILKLLPLIALTIGGFLFIHWDYFRPFNASGLSASRAIAGSAALTLYAFLGIECASIPAGNIINPERTIPRATMWGTGLTIFIYMLSMTVIMGLLPPQTLQHSVTPFADAAVAIWGPTARYWMAAGAALAGFGALNGWILVQGQVPMAIARDRLFPAIFGKENKKGVPALGILISSVLVSIFMTMNFTKGLVEQFQFLLLLSTLTSIIPFAMVTASYVITVIRRQQTRTRGEWTRVLLPACLAFIFAILAVIGAGETIVFWGLVLLLAGIPLYVWMMWEKIHSKNKGSDPPDPIP
jgi:basic amino acid/polyamine antiporter, APA family